MSLAQVPVQSILLHGSALWWRIVVLSLVCVGLLALFFLINKRFVKILCACGVEVSVWLFVRDVWGPDSLGAQILCYITAAAAIILTVAIVNRIDWSNMGPKKYK